MAADNWSAVVALASFIRLGEQEGGAQRILPSFERLGVSRFLFQDLDNVKARMRLDEIRDLARAEAKSPSFRIPGRTVLW